MARNSSNLASESAYQRSFDLCDESESGSIDLTRDRPSKRKKPSFELQGLKFFGTVPQCDMAADDVLMRIRVNKENPDAPHLPELEWAFVVQESHKTEGMHIHFGLKFKSRLHTTNVNVFDFITGKHGHYETMRSVKRSVEYLAKENGLGAIKSWGIDLKSVMANHGTQSKSNMVADAILERKQTYTDIVHMEGMSGFAMMKATPIKNFISYCASAMPTRPVEKFVEIKDENCARFKYNYIIANWLNQNLLKPRIFGAKQLYIWGDTMTGKTTLLNCIEKFGLGYWIPKYENFHDLYADNKYICAFFDEWEPEQKPRTFMNSFLDGAPLILRTKGGQVVKRENLPVIICSNHDPDEVYTGHSARMRATFIRRLTVIHVSGFIDVGF